MSTKRFSVEDILELCGGQFPEADGFNWEEVEYFLLEDGMLQPYEGEVVLPGPALIVKFTALSLEDEHLPRTIVDSDGEEKDKKTWKFYGPFPLEEISRGRRACRSGWRTTSKDFASMLAVVVAGKPGNIQLCLEYELEAESELEPFNDVEDMLSLDWYAEVIKE